MSETPPNELTVDELQRLLTRVDAAALLVPPRILRRVIKRDRGLAGLGLQVPHRKSYVIARERLLRIADRDELALKPDRELPPMLLLLPRPDRQRLDASDRAATLLKYWRLLFHARIHLAFQGRSAAEMAGGTGVSPVQRTEDRRDAGPTTTQDRRDAGPTTTQDWRDAGPTGSELRQRIQRLGLTELDEAAAVLRQEQFLLPPGDARTIYEEFASVYLELRYFAPHLLPLYFPACSRLETIDATLAEDVDAAALFAATRVEGAPDPASLPPSEGERGRVSAPSDEPSDEPREALGVLMRPQSPDAPRAYLRLLERAEKASASGNMVRAAVFRMRAIRLAPSGQANPTRAAAHRELEHFSRRLQHALGYTDEVAADWRQALFALLEPASRGIWPSESRLLYDLQKACIDRERPVFAVDLIEWLVTWGRRPIKRLLPFHDSVRLIKHLRSASRRATASRIAEPIRRRLITRLTESTHLAEHRLRERLLPVMREVLDRVGLTPRNVAEQVARDKVVEELIDLVVEHGFLGLGDLRDALARNRLKLPDLTAAETETRISDASQKRCGPRRFCEASLTALARGLKTFFLGDPLIRANRRLTSDLDGVYHRGEVYLRWLQRLSAAAFGTAVGRIFTLYVALPFGCSLAVLKVWDEVVDLIHGAPSEGSEAEREAARHIDPYAFMLLGLFFLALFHIGPFRRGLLWTSVKTWHGLHWLLADLPASFVRLPWVVRILQSRPWLFFYQFIFKPLPWAALCTFGLYSLGLGQSLSLAVGAGVFVMSSLLLNSRLGLYVEEAATDSLVRTWQLIHADLVPGLVRWVIYLFRRLQEEVERLIYTVDEWLRFRPGDSRLSLGIKPILGLLWFCFTYLFRMLFNVFVEPTFNPIKHFPTVTVAAKLVAPFWLQVPQLVEYLEPVIGKLLASMVVPTVLFLLPGLAGFLVWEFKENWRLYRANQSPTLRPEIVGHHGETVLRLMRPGLHSGTLPKLYARLRHTRGRSPRKQYEALHHLRQRLRQLVERNLFAILSGSKSWGNVVHLTVGEIHIATNRIRIELEGPASSIHVDFEEHGGWLLAGLTCLTRYSQTWLSHLTPEQSTAFRDALGGLYKLARVDVVREQIEAQLPTGTAYDLTENGLVVWPLSGREGEVVYDLEARPEITPRLHGPSMLPVLPPLAADTILFSETPIRWSDWVQAWQLDHDGKGHAPLLPLRMRLLPLAACGLARAR